MAFKSGLSCGRVFDPTISATGDEDTEPPKSAFCLEPGGSSANVFLPSLSDSSFIIPLGSKITVRSLSGKIVFANEVASVDTQMPIYLLGVLMFIAKKMSLPARCAQISWTFKMLSTGLSCEGVIIWNADNEDDEEDIYEPDNPMLRCFICESDCVDVDETTGDRHKNCARCFPCSLCEKCKIHLPKQAFDDQSRRCVRAYRRRSTSPARVDWPVCFYCLKDSDLLFMKHSDLSSEQCFRLSVLNSDFSARLSDI